MRNAPVFITACLLVSLATKGTAREAQAGYDHGAGRQSYWSPDHTLRAVVVDLPPRGYGEAESVVEVRAASGRRLARRDYSSLGGGSGQTVVRGEWTPDARFFVFSTESSGGHSPWHSPTHVYSRRRGRFFRLDDFTGPTTTAHFRLSARDEIRTQTLARGPVAVSLRRLERELTVASEEETSDR